MGNKDDRDLTRIEELVSFEHTDDVATDSFFDKVSLHSEDLGQSPFDNTTFKESDSTFSPDVTSHDSLTTENNTTPDWEMTNNLDTATESEIGDSTKNDFDETSQSDLEQTVEYADPSSETLSLDATEKVATEFSPHQVANDPAGDLAFLETPSYSNSSTPPVSSHSPLQKLKDDNTHFASEIRSVMPLGSCNPPFSVVVTGIKYVEESDAIKDALRDLELINQNNESDFQLALETGALLLPQVSEFTAILFLHKIRHLGLNLKMGLSEEISKPKSYKHDQTGLVSKRTTSQNKALYFEESQKKLTADDIVVTLSNMPHEYTIKRYIDIATEQIAIKAADLLMDNDLHRENSIDLYYQTLTNKLRDKAVKANANGIVNVTYSTTPIHLEDESERYYQILATGNLVWLISNH